MLNISLDIVINSQQFIVLILSFTWSVYSCMARPYGCGKCGWWWGQPKDIEVNHLAIDGRGRAG